MNKTPLILLTWAFAIILAILIIAELTGNGILPRPHFWGIGRYWRFIVFGIILVISLMTYWFRDERDL